MTWDGDTLVAALHRRADAGEAPALWLEALDGGGEDVSCAELLDASLRSAAALAAGGVGRGDRVVIVLPTGRDFVTTFFGTLAAAATPVPLYPPAAPHQLPGFLASLARVVGLVRPAKVVTLAPLDEAVRAHAGIGEQTDVVAAESIRGEDARAADAPAPPEPGDLALIQFSSGSTSDPRGVALTHANIMHNISAFGRGIPLGPPDRGVSWLPLYHDMGLIGTLLGTMVREVPLALFSPLDFLRRPAFWFEVITRRESTIGVAPQFAYNLCLAKIRDEDLEGIDLSSLNVLLNGAEPVDAEVVRAFEERFAPWGLRPGVVTPCYGLAESALAVTMGNAGKPIPVRRLDRDSGHVVARAADEVAERTMTVASAGAPLGETEVAILAPDGSRLPDETVGEIAVRSPSVCQGHVSEDGVVPLADAEGWLRTGDLGFLAGGELYPVDRRKDLVIVAGRNVYPHDLEREIASVPGTRRGRIAVFGVADAALGTEGVVVAAEVPQLDAGERARLATAIRRTVVSGLGVTPYDVVLLGRSGLPLTSSGKVRRHKMRELYERGELGDDAYSLRQASGRERVPA
jgi:acyl-CoA synthetase (AMP-forming)/AMP-acid ligase II